MRSRLFTTLILLLAIALGTLVFLRLRDGNLDSLLGSPAIPEGQRIYDSFVPQDVRSIEITTPDTTANFTLTDKGWQALSPWQDRMDPRAAAGIITFTLGLNVQDSAPNEKVRPEESGLAAHPVRIRLFNSADKPLANYLLGRTSPWLSEAPEGDPYPTVFIKPRDKHHHSHTYIATGDITQIFKENLRLLRDHRPFFFNPLNLKSIRIRDKQGEILLSRPSLQSPWRIEKPLDLGTNVNAVKSLLEGLYNLTADSVSNRDEVTLPAPSANAPNRQIAITSFGDDAETVLEVYPPATPEATTSLATVSNRTNTVFSFPTGTNAKATLASLPLTVDELRDRTLTHIDTDALKGIAIQPTIGTTVVLTHPPKKPWMAAISGQRFEANQQLVSSLLKAVTNTQAIGVESDAATNFTPWGLDHPILRLLFVGQDKDNVIELRFGNNARGDLFANRLGSATVMRLDPAFLTAIATHPYKWQHQRIWSIDRTNLTTVSIEKPNTPPLDLRYDFLADSWTAKRDDKDLTDRLAPTKANYFLSILEGLEVERWLATNDAEATLALAKPALTITATEKIEDDLDDGITEVRTYQVRLSPITTGPLIGNFYGLASTNPHPFVLSSDTYQKLTAPLLD